MARLKKNYTFSSKRNIWRLIPAESDLLVIEERDTASKEVFFNCLTLAEGKPVFTNLQFDEKYWIGIEAVHKHIIYFHKFSRPNLPGHKGIYAYDVFERKIIWQNDDLQFLFADEDKVYSYQQTFDGRKFFVIDFLTGSLMSELEEDSTDFNKLRANVLQSDFLNSFLFPSVYNEILENSEVDELIKQIFSEYNVVGHVNWLKYLDLILISFHEKNSNGTYNNYFRAYDVGKRKYIHKDTLNSKSKSLVPDSFFVLRNLLFLLIEKNKLVVYRIIQ